MRMLRLFAAYGRAGFSLLAAYRLDFWIGRLRTLVVFFAVAWLWLAVFPGRTAGGYDAASMFTYVLVAGLLFGLVFANSIEKEVSEDIASGTLNNMLTRPASYLWMRWSLFWPVRLLVLPILPLQIILIAFVLPHAPVRLPTAPLPWILFCVSAVLACMLFFLMEMLAGYVAFWLFRAYGARWMLHIFMVFGSGAYLPTTIMPATVAQLIFLTPYPWIIYGPVSFLATPASASPVILLVQLAWIAILAAASALVWRAGLQRYEAAGI